MSTGSTFMAPYLLSILIAALSVVASAGGLFWGGLYRDNALVTAAFRGNDLVTLAVAAPLLIGALPLAARGSLRAQLVWMGMLGYTLYNYAFYLFGAAFNAFFLVYVALFASSILALVLGLPRIDADGVRQRFRDRTPVRGISGFMAFFALLLGGMWVVRAGSFLVTGEVPADIVNTAHPTGVVYAIDLSLLVPSLLLGAALLWQRRAWGYVVSSMLMIKATTYALALIAMSPFAARAGVPGAWDLVPVWIFLGLGCLIAGGFLLGNMRPTVEGVSSAPP